MRKRLAFLFVSIICFLIGGCIYMTMRDSSLYMFSWFFSESIPQWLLSTRASICIKHIPQWVYYSLPDGLWLLSFLLLIEYIWGKGSDLLKNIFLYSMPFLAIVVEFTQWAKLTIGTGDWMDVICYIAGIFIYITLKQIIYHEKKN